MSNASDNMTSKLSAEDLNQELKATARALESTKEFKSSRLKNTAAALLGSAAAVGLTALSPRSNKVSVGLTAGFATLNTADAFLNKQLNETVATNVAGHVGVGIGKFATTSLFGAAMNAVFGKDGIKDEVEAELETETEQPTEA